MRSLTHDIADIIFPSSRALQLESLETIAPLTVMSLSIIPVPPSPPPLPTGGGKKPPGGGKKNLKAPSNGGGQESSSSSVTAAKVATADKDAIGMLACTVCNVYGSTQSDSFKSVVFVVVGDSRNGGVEGRTDVDIRYYKNEKECLRAWLEWAVEEDADCWATFEAQNR